ncbi:MAG: hypothetical protein JRN20_07860 [Nitrososphaerota archaeon]|nr:hypothetical protein [Nitrososphaerota archaeon]
MDSTVKTPVCTALAVTILFGTLGFFSPFVSAQTQPTGPVARPSCGWDSPSNATEIVASSPAGSIALSVGAPSWEYACFSYGGPNGSTVGISFVSYEVFPITIHAQPNTTINLQTGSANPSPQQVAQGIHNNTIWTWFNPDSVITNSSGLAVSNMTLAGAVMPFVPNDFGNVSLPITGTMPSGLSATAGLPIDFVGSPGGNLLILNSPSPIAFGSGVGGEAGAPSQSLFGVVYSPTGANSSEIQASFKVLGTYENGKVGPMPSGITVSFPQSSFVLQPNSVMYFAVAESNDMKLSNTTIAANYTLAIQENIGNATYVVPMTITISLWQTLGGGLGVDSGLASTVQKNAFASINIVGGWVGVLLVSTVAIIAVTAAAALVWRRKLEQQSKEETSVTTDVT